MVEGVGPGGWGLWLRVKGVRLKIYQQRQHPCPRLPPPTLRQEAGRRCIPGGQPGSRFRVGGFGFRVRFSVQGFRLRVKGQGSRV